jgi:hypothetical protein
VPADASQHISFDPQQSLPQHVSPAPQQPPGAAGQHGPSQHSPSQQVWPGSQQPDPH